MAYVPTNAQGRVVLSQVTAGQDPVVIAVVLRNELIRFEDGASATTIVTDTDIRVRPTNTTATINVVAANTTTQPTTAPPRESERDQAKVILLQAGPKGGFSQTARLPEGHYFVSANVLGVITDD